MAILRIYGDEAGTMPIDDNGGIFVTATVSILGDAPIITNKNGHKKVLVKKIRDLNAIPQVIFIDPKAGYGDALRKKFNKMNIMARTTRLMTGTNKQYLTKYGIQLRNHIWVFCMSQVIGKAVVSAANREKIDKVEIVLDQKTMALPTKRMFKDLMAKLSNQLLRAIKGVKQQYVDEVKLYKMRINFSRETISLCMRDETSACGSGCGLQLAHYLASHFCDDIKNRKFTMKNLFSEEGFSSIDTDVTNKLLAPINRKNIENWEKNTGLREPK